MIPPQDGQKTGQRIEGDASHVRSTPAAAHNQLGQDEVCKRILVRTVVNLGIKLNFQQLIFLGSYPIIGNLEIDASTKHDVCHSLLATGFRQPSKIKVLIFKLLSDSVVVMVILLKTRFNLRWGLFQLDPLLVTTCCEAVWQKSTPLGLISCSYLRYN